MLPLLQRLGGIIHVEVGSSSENFGFSLANFHTTHKFLGGGLAMRYHVCMSRYAFTRPTLLPSLMRHSGIQSTKPPLCVLIGGSGVGKTVTVRLAQCSKAVTRTSVLELICSARLVPRLLLQHGMGEASTRTTPSTSPLRRGTNHV